MKSETGLFDRAVRSSAIVGVVSGVGWVALIAVDLSQWSNGDEFMTRPMHVLALCLLVTASVLAVMIQCTARLINGQRQVLAELAAPPRCGYAEGFADGLARRPAAASNGRHLTMVDVGPGD